MAKIVHAADLHLNSPLHGLSRYYPSEDWHAPSRQALAALVAATIEESADALVLAGDVVDRDWYSDDVALLLSRSLRTLDEAGVTVLVVDGNHDADCNAWKRLTDIAGRLPPRVRWVGAGEAHSVVLDEAGIALHGRGVPTASAADLVSTFAPPRSGLLNVGVLHTSLDRPPPVKPCAPTTASILAESGYDYWALGHLHQREVVNTEPWIVVAGNTQGRTATDTGPKGATVVETAAGRMAAVRLRELASVRWEYLRVDSTAGRHVTDLADLALARLQIAAATLPSDQRLAVRLELADNTLTAEDHGKIARLIRAAASSDQRFLIERIDVTQAPKR